MCDTQGEASAIAAARGPWMLQMGYWSDEMAARREGADVFFTAVEHESELGEDVELLLEAWVDKYGEECDFDDCGLDRQDLFWSCAPRVS